MGKGGSEGRMPLNASLTYPFPFANHASSPLEVLRVLAGSHAYGLAHEGSDVDVRGVYILPTEVFLGLAVRIPTKAPQTLSTKLPDATWYELGHFCHLGLQANPNILELLYTDSNDILVTSPTGEVLRELRRAFLSRRIGVAYGGFAVGQRKRLKLEGVRAVDYDHKAAVHLLRVATQGLSLLRTGELDVRVSPKLQEVLASIYAGEVPLSALLERADHLLKLLDDQVASSVLPEGPDVEAVEAFLVRTRTLALHA